MLHALLVLPPLYLAFWDFWYAKIFSRAPWIKMGAAPPLSTFAGVFRGLAHILILTEKYHQKSGGGAKNLFILEAAKQEK